jgi:hypothetical protein
VRNTLRILGISLALVALLVFATGVVSDWNHQNSNDETRCPYCHLGHQTPAQLEAAPAVSLLRPVASLPLPEDFAAAGGPALSQISPGAPPAAKPFPLIVLRARRSPIAIQFNRNSRAPLAP